MYFTLHGFYTDKIQEGLWLELRTPSFEPNALTTNLAIVSFLLSGQIIADSLLRGGSALIRRLGKAKISDSSERSKCTNILLGDLRLKHDQTSRASWSAISRLRSLLWVHKDRLWDVWKTCKEKIAYKSLSQKQGSNRTADCVTCIFHANSTEVSQSSVFFREWRIPLFSTPSFSWQGH